MNVSRTAKPAIDIEVSSSSGSFESTSTSETDVTNLSITITTKGRPVVIGLLQQNGVGHIRVANGGVANYAIVVIKRDSTTIYATTVGASDADVSNTYIASSAIHTIDTPVAGTYTYKVRTLMLDSAGLVAFTSCKLVAYEL